MLRARPSARRTGAAVLRQRALSPAPVATPVFVTVTVTVTVTEIRQIGGRDRRVL
jgi:hypothetical protein